METQEDDLFDNLPSSNQLQTQTTEYIHLRNNVFNDIISPNYQNEIKDVVLWKYRWQVISNWSEILAQILFALSTIAAFIATSSRFEDNVEYIILSVGILNTVYMALLKFSEYAESESIERSKILGNLLSIINIENIPSTSPLEVVSRTSTS